MPPSAPAPVFEPPTNVSSFNWIQVPKPAENKTPFQTPGENRPPEPEKPIDVSGVPELRGGVLNIGLDVGYAPMEFYADGSKTPAGLDIDVAAAVAEKLNVQMKFHDTHFDGIVKGLRSKKFDVILSAMTITEEREREIDFVTYYAGGTMGTGIIVAKGNPGRVKRVDDLCGLRVAVQEGTVQHEELKNRPPCANRKLKMNVNTCKRNTEALDLLRRGKVDAVLADLAVGLHEVKLSGGEIELAPHQFKYVPYGIGVRKESGELKKALAEAVKALNQRASIDGMVRRWGLQ